MHAWLAVRRSSLPTSRCAPAFKSPARTACGPPLCAIFAVCPTPSHPPPNCRCPACEILGIGSGKRNSRHQNRWKGLQGFRWTTVERHSRGLPRPPTLTPVLRNRPGAYLHSHFPSLRAERLVGILCPRATPCGLRSCVTSSLRLGAKCV